MPAQQKYSLRYFNTFGLEQYCLALHEAPSKAEVAEICTNLYQQDQTMLVLGGGSNILLTEDFEGTVIRVAWKGLKVRQDDEYYYLEVEAGEDWHTLVCFCLDQGMAGLENLALIPGTVGAAPIQNIGAYGIEFKKFCHWVEYVDLATGKLMRLSPDECEFGYRESIFKGALRGRFVITCVGLKLAKAWEPVLEYGPLVSAFDAESVKPRQIFDFICDIRSSKIPDPKELGNAGSFFKNPVISRQLFNELRHQYQGIPGYPQDTGLVKVAAGWLVERAGLKGFTLGNAAVHEQQALVLVNKGGATGKEIVQLALTVIEQVERLFGVVLEAEPRIIAAHGEVSLIKGGREKQIFPISKRQAEGC